MLFAYGLALLHACLAVSAGPAIVRRQDTQYSVISLVTADTSMAVVVDDHEPPYPLSSLSSALLFGGSAPAAEHGYYYAKINSAGQVLEREPFVRDPFDGEKTPNEHYNRTWNKWDITQLPQALEPIPAIHRIDSNLHVDGQIPTIHIVGDPQAIDNMHQSNMADIQVMTTMTYISLDNVQTFSDVEFELSGRNSRQSAKLAYNIKLPKQSELEGYRRLKLRSLATDPSYIREDLGYKMIRAAGVPCTDSSYVRLYVNDQPIGLFGLVERFKNPWLQNEFANGDNDYPQGILYQGKYTTPTAKALGNRVSDLSYYGDDAAPYAQGEYDIEEDPSSPGTSDYSALMRVTKFLQNPPATTDAWESHFDMESVIRGLALEMVLGFGDGYWSMVDNYYLYQTAPESIKFIFMLWDIDFSLGSTFPIRLADLETGDWHAFAGGVLDKRPLLKFIQVPEYAERLDTVIRELTDTLLDLDGAVGNRIDDTAAMLQEDVDWDQSCPRVSNTDLSLIDLSSVASVASLLGFMQEVKLDPTTAVDYGARQRNQDVGFMQAVDGPTGHISLAGVKEYIRVKRENVVNYYDTKNQ